MRRCVYLVAPVRQLWTARIRSLEAQLEETEFLLAPPPKTPADLDVHSLEARAGEGLVVVVDLAGDPARGISTVAACRHLAPRVPVIVVADTLTPDLVRRVRLAGIFYLALHPVDQEELRKAIESAFDCLSRSRSLSSRYRDRRRLLLIDDDQDFLASTRALLESQDYRVTTAGSGKEGLERMTEEVPDLIVLDIMMENDWAGYEVNQRVKFGSGFECTRNVPILMVSSIPVDPATRFSRAGEVDMVTPDAYMTKPLDIPKFLATVRALLGESVAEVAL